jgi:hypothetical protein
MTQDHRPNIQVTGIGQTRDFNKVYSFSDEPGEEDLPKYTIIKETILRRVPFDGRNQFDLHTVKRDWKEEK